MRVLAAALLTLGLAACGGESEDGAPRERAVTVVEPETRVDTVPEEEPGVARTQWRAVSDEARAITGNLRVSLEGTRGGPVIFAFANGITITAQPYDVVPADSRSGVGGQSLAALLGGDPRVDVYLYRVENENISRSAERGGLCGNGRSRHMAVSEFVDGSGRWVFKIAAFSGEARPASGADPEFCGAYAYTAQ
jgi:hypothetical protein